MIESTRQGAFTCVLKPINRDKWLKVIKQALPRAAQRVFLIHVRAAGLLWPDGIRASQRGASLPTSTEARLSTK
jgi:hypothetical protein